MQAAYSYDDNRKILLDFMGFPGFDKEHSSIILPRLYEDPKKQAR